MVLAAAIWLSALVAVAPIGLVCARAVQRSGRTLGRDLQHALFRVARVPEASPLAEPLGWVPLALIGAVLSAAALPLSRRFVPLGALVAALVVGRGIARRFDGLTGDCYGFFIVGEVALTAVCAALEQ